RYYWVTTQSEYSTDVLFRNRQALSELYPKLLSHSMNCFGAKEVMRFLGRKLVGQLSSDPERVRTPAESRPGRAVPPQREFQGEITTDVREISTWQSAGFLRSGSRSYRRRIYAHELP